MFRDYCVTLFQRNGSPLSEDERKALYECVAQGLYTELQCGSLGAMFLDYYVERCERIYKVLKPKYTKENIVASLEDMELSDFPRFSEALGLGDTLYTIKDADLSSLVDKVEILMANSRPNVGSSFKESMKDVEGILDSDSLSGNLQYLSGLDIWHRFTVCDDIAMVLAGYETTMFDLAYAWVKIEAGFPTLKSEFVVL